MRASLPRATVTVTTFSANLQATRDVSVCLHLHCHLRFVTINMEIMPCIDYCFERIYVFLLSYFLRWFQVSEQQLLNILFTKKDNFDLICECILMTGCFISLIGLTNGVLRKTHALGDSLVWASTCYVCYLAFTEMMEEFSQRC